jgi:hypothetical protein
LCVYVATLRRADHSSKVSYRLCKKSFFFLPRCSHTWGLAPALEHRAEFPQFLDQGQSVGLLGRVISSSQGLYLYTNTKHPCTEWDSNPWSRLPSERRQCTP